MVKPKGDKQVEYLDLDLDSGKSTPPRKVSKSSTLAFFFLPSSFVASSCRGRESLLNCPTVHLFVKQSIGEPVLDLSEKPVVVLYLFGTPTYILLLIYFNVGFFALPCLPQKKISGSGSSVADERVDYVVVDQQKTLALKSTREAWTDGRQSTESETPAKSVK